MNRAISALVCAVLVSPWLLPGAARAEPPAPALPRLALVPPNGENPLDLLRRGRRNAHAGKVLVALGAINAAIAAGSSIALFALPRDQQGAALVLFGAAGGSGFVAAHFLAAGIPALVGGQRQERRALAWFDALPDEERDVARIERRWDQPPDVARAQAEKSKWKGLSLMIIGGANLAMMAGSAAAIGPCINGCSTAVAVALFPATVFTGIAGLFTMGFGGRYYVDARRRLDHLDGVRPASHEVELSLLVGSTVGVAGTF